MTNTGPLPRLGVVGLGKIGSAITERLISCGHQPTIWNRTKARAEPLAARARVAASLADLVAASDVIITSLTDDDAVNAVYGEILNGDVKGRLFIETSTILPETTRGVAERVAAQGGAAIDAPMSGTVEPARTGQLLALVGGSPQDVDRARPVLDILCRKVVHLGPSGSGASMKLVMNLPLSVYWASLAEALTLGKTAGLDLATMVELIADSKAAIGALPPKVPVLLGKDAPVSFDIGGMRKDLVLMAEAASAIGVPSPVTSAAASVFTGAVQGGWGAKDCASIARFSMSKTTNS